MNKHSLPWFREWEQLDLEMEMERDSVSLLKMALSVIALVALMLIGSLLFADGLVAEAELAEARAEGHRLGRLELIQRVQQEVDDEGKTWTAFYRAASKPGLSGFDGVVLVEAKQ